jgi:tetratricopeptide (TPR) repeat protein
MTTLSNNYVFKALDYFPHNLGDTMEALNYALSYDEKNITALILAGRVYAEYAYDYNKARYYFNKALEVDLNSPFVYPYLAQLHFDERNIASAKRVIQYGIKIKGADKSQLYQILALCYEFEGNCKKGIKTLKKALQFTFDIYNSQNIHDEIKRIEKKMKA